MYDVYEYMYIHRTYLYVRAQAANVISDILYFQV